MSSSEDRACDVRRTAVNIGQDTRRRLVVINKVTKKLFTGNNTPRIRLGYPKLTRILTTSWGFLPRCSIWTPHAVFQAQKSADMTLYLAY
jgi:hypothetical protein